LEFDKKELSTRHLIKGLFDLKSLQIECRKIEWALDNTLSNALQVVLPILPGVSSHKLTK